MSDELIKKFSQQNCKNEIPQIRAGFRVRVHQKIKEGKKERIQIFEGMVIRKNCGSDSNETFTVRKISEKIGVEKVFLIHSPNIVKIEILRAHKVRRGKLHFLRKLSGKALRLKEVPLKFKTKKFVKIEKKIDEKNAENEKIEKNEIEKKVENKDEKTKK